MALLPTKTITLLQIGIEKAADNVFVPLTVGGGIRKIDDIRSLLLAGADKVSINTAAVDNPDLVKKSARKLSF